MTIKKIAIGKKLLILPMLAAVIVASFLFLRNDKGVPMALAFPSSTNHNVHGYAWSGQYDSATATSGAGWISFSCQDRVCIEPGGGPYGKATTTLNGNPVSCINNTCLANGGRCWESCWACSNSSLTNPVICSSTAETTTQCGSSASDLCVSNNFGVDINKATNNGNFEGYAWSPLVGWIAFTRQTVCANNPAQYCNTPVGTPDVPNCGAGNNCVYESLPSSAAISDANCGPTSNCDTLGSCTACYNSSDKKVYGWAKVVNLGNDGWIRLDDDNPSVAPAYGVSYNPADQEFYGFAWNAGGRCSLASEFSCPPYDCALNGYGTCDPTIGLGYISFNCASSSPTGGSVCGSSDFAVRAGMNSAPTTTNFRFSLPSGSPHDYAACWDQCACDGFSSNDPRVEWNFVDEDAVQTQYKIVFATSTVSLANLNNWQPANSIYNRCIATGTVANSFSTMNFTHCASMSSAIKYNQIYHAYVMVWDSEGATSSWNHISTTTYDHKSPVVDFDWLPKSISGDEEVRFFDQSHAYIGNADRSHVDPCNDDPSRCDWSWSFYDNMTPLVLNTDYEIASGTLASSSLVVKFKKRMSSLKVGLNVRDKIGNRYRCLEEEAAMKVNYKLPNWRER